MSSDRLKRVQDSSQSMDSQRPSKRVKLSSGVRLQNDQTICKREEISIGEWCLFALDFDDGSFTEVAEQNVINNTIIGIVLAFQYSDGKTDKQKQHRRDSALTSQNDISVLSNWHMINSEGNLTSLKHSNSFYVPMNKYLATVDNSKSNIQITKENLDLLQTFDSN